MVKFEDERASDVFKSRLVVGLYSDPEALLASAIVIFLKVDVGVEVFGFGLKCQKYRVLFVYVDHVFGQLVIPWVFVRCCCSWLGSVQGGRITP